MFTHKCTVHTKIIIVMSLMFRPHTRGSNTCDSDWVTFRKRMFLSSGFGSRSVYFMCLLVSLSGINCFWRRYPHGFHRCFYSSPVIDEAVVCRRESIVCLDLMSVWRAICHQAPTGSMCGQLDYKLSSMIAISLSSLFLTKSVTENAQSRPLVWSTASDWFCSYTHTDILITGCITENKQIQLFVLMVWKVCFLSSSVCIQLYPRRATKWRLLTSAEWLIKYLFVILWGVFPTLGILVWNCHLICHYFWLKRKSCLNAYSMADFISE